MGDGGRGQSSEQGTRAHAWADVSQPGRTRYCPAMKYLRPRYILFVFLVTVGILGGLAWSGTVDAQSCTATKDTAKRERWEPPAALGLSVKTGDLQLTKDLRAAVEERLAARGFAKLVDNPVQRPRADVALEQGALRWTPFYATMQTQLKVLITLPKGGAAQQSEVLKIDSTCMGLVSQTPWRDARVAELADQAADAIAGK
jgi:hypothetical protein